MNTQVYDIVVDITAMYERYNVPISVDEANRLLDAIQGVQAVQAVQPPPLPYQTLANGSGGFNWGY